MIVLTWRIADGEWRGAELKDYVTVIESTAGRVVALLQALKVRLPADGLLDAKTLIGKTAVIVCRNDPYVGQDGEMRDSTKIKAYKPIEGGDAQLRHPERLPGRRGRRGLRRRRAVLRWPPRTTEVCGVSERKVTPEGIAEHRSEMAGRWLTTAADKIAELPTEAYPFGVALVALGWQLAAVEAQLALIAERR